VPLKSFVFRDTHWKKFSGISLTKELRRTDPRGGNFLSRFPRNSLMQLYLLASTFVCNKSYAVFPANRLILLNRI